MTIYNWTISTTKIVNWYAQGLTVAFRENFEADELNTEMWSFYDIYGNPADWYLANGELFGELEYGGTSPGIDPLSATSIANEANRNLPPKTPSNPLPPDGATNELTGQFLSWTGGDPDGDLVKYDVWFGEGAPNGLIVENISEEEFFVGNLPINTLFAWQVVAIDETGLTNESPIWNLQQAIQTILTATD